MPGNRTRLGNGNKRTMPEKCSGNRTSDKSIFTVEITRDTQGTSNFLVNARTGKVMWVKSGPVLLSFSFFVPFALPHASGEVLCCGDSRDAIEVRQRKVEHRRLRRMNCQFNGYFCLAI